MRYKITFLDYWHLSSGLSGGAKLDSSVVKDSEGIPYVPGKTIKGLLREMVALFDEEKASRWFGEEEVKQGSCYFSNATLSQASIDAIITNNLQEKLYNTIASTKINENGVADDKSLREIEVVIPLTLYGEIKHCDDNATMHQAMRMLKRMGLNRNRGLGRCIIEPIGDEK